MKEVLLALAVSTLVASPAFANLSGLTGTYGCVVNTNAAPFEVLKTTNASSSNFVQANTLETINFTTNQWTGSFVGTLNFNTTSALSGTTTNTGTVVETAGPISGTYTETVTYTGGAVSGATNVVYNILPVNGNHTLFIQRYATSRTELPETGACQLQ